MAERLACDGVEELVVGCFGGGWMGWRLGLGSQGVAGPAEERHCMQRMAAMVLEGVSADWGIVRRRKAAMAQGGT